MSIYFPEVLAWLTQDSVAEEVSAFASKDDMFAITDLSVVSLMMALHAWP